VEVGAKLGRSQPANRVVEGTFSFPSGENIPAILPFTPSIPSILSTLRKNKNITYYRKEEG
jgi:hypothetical protein